MPGAAFIEKLLLKFPDLDARWLLTGEGEMIVNSEIYISANNHEEIPATGVKTLIKEEIKERETLVTQDKKLERIVLLYTDGSFEDYKK